MYAIATTSASDDALLELAVVALCAFGSTPSASASVPLELVIRHPATCHELGAGS